MYMYMYIYVYVYREREREREREIDCQAAIKRATAENDLKLARAALDRPPANSG